MFEDEEDEGSSCLDDKPIEVVCNPVVHKGGILRKKCSGLSDSSTISTKSVYWDNDDDSTSSSEEEVEGSGISRDPKLLRQALVRYHFPGSDASIYGRFDTTLLGRLRQAEVISWLLETSFIVAAVRVCGLGFPVRNRPKKSFNILPLVQRSVPCKRFRRALTMLSIAYMTDHRITQDTTLSSDEDEEFTNPFLFQPVLCLELEDDVVKSYPECLEDEEFIAKHSDIFTASDDTEEEELLTDPKYVAVADEDSVELNDWSDAVDLAKNLAKKHRQCVLLSIIADELSILLGSPGNFSTPE